MPDPLIALDPDDPCRKCFGKGFTREQDGNGTIRDDCYVCRGTGSRSSIRRQSDVPS